MSSSAVLVNTVVQPVPSLAHSLWPSRTCFIPCLGTALGAASWWCLAGAHQCLCWGLWECCIPGQQSFLWHFLANPAMWSHQCSPSLQTLPISAGWALWEGCLLGTVFLLKYTLEWAAAALLYVPIRAGSGAACLKCATWFFAFLSFVVILSSASFLNIML